MISSPKCVNGCFRSHLVYDLLSHGENVVLLLPEHHEALQPVHQAGQPHGVALVDQQGLGCGAECGRDDLLPGLPRPGPGLVTHIVVQLPVGLAVGGGGGGTCIYIRGN